jgi:hypothetical protein
MPNIRYRIHPAIGVARVGDAARGPLLADDAPPRGWFIGPETPGVPANWDFSASKCRSFRESDGLKAQAARFRIWSYEKDALGRWAPVRELTLKNADVKEIRWRVHLANRKASFYEFNGPVGEAGPFGPRRNAAVEDRTALELDDGEKTIAGRRASGIMFRNSSALIPRTIARFGELLTDDVGRLIVLGGYGKSDFNADLPLRRGQDFPGHVPSYANNNGWFDDVSDGPVRATVVLADGAEIEADAAWVLAGPPDFVPGLAGITTLYEAIADVAVRAAAFAFPADLALYASGGALAALGAMRAAWQGRTFRAYRPSFTREIFPILSRAFQFDSLSWGEANLHRFFEWLRFENLNKADSAMVRRRQRFFRWLRDPDGADLRPARMPRARGDAPYLDRPNAQQALTRLQYALLRQWRDGAFDDDWETGGEPATPAADDITPHGLDRAALDGCVGGAFYPGIEASWLIRQAEIFSEPFRIALGRRALGLEVRAGFFSQQMAVPWQADFRDCRREANALEPAEDRENGIDPLEGEYEFAWWPAQRPDRALLLGSADTVPRWWTRGLLSGQGHPNHLGMVQGWSSRGVVVPARGSVHQEVEGPPPGDANAPNPDDT